MNESPIVDSWVKLDRANHHIAELLELLPTNRVGDGYFYELDETVTLGGKPALKLRFKRPDRRTWAIAGEALHQLRSSLDLAVVAMSRLNTPGCDCKRVHFPIAKDLKNFQGADAQKKMLFLSARAKSYITSLRPYGGAGGNELIWGLNDARNADTHVELAVLAAAVQVSNIVRSNPNGDLVETMVAGCVGGVILAACVKDPGFLRDGALIDISDFSVLFTDPIDVNYVAKVANKHAQLAISVCFSADSPFSGSPTVSKLKELSQLVEGILRGLEAEA